MKKTVSILLAIVLLCAMSINAFAAENSENTESIIYQINCDTADGWQAPINATDPYVDFISAGGNVDTEDKMEGTGSLSMVGNPDAFAGPAVNFQYIPSESIDLSALKETGELRFWLYTSNPSFHVMNECQFEVTSSGSFDVNEMQWKLDINNLKLQQGWNEVVLKVSDATSQGGECDLTKVNYIRFWCLMMPADTVIKLDDLRFVSKHGTAIEEIVPEPTELVSEITETAPTAITYTIDCDSVDGWLAPKSDAVGYLGFLEAGGSLDTENKKQGSASLSLDANQNVYGGPAVNFSYIPETNVDLQLTKENGEVRFWLYTNDPNIHAMKECQFEISSSGFWDQNEMTWKLMPNNLQLQEGWNEVVLKMSDAVYTGGECDLSNINYVRFYCLMMPLDAVVKIDDIRFGVAPGEDSATEPVVVQTESVEEATEALSESIPEVQDDIEMPENGASFNSVLIAFGVLVAGVIIFFVIKRTKKD